MLSSARNLHRIIASFLEVARFLRQEFRRERQSSQLEQSYAELRN